MRRAVVLTALAVECKAVIEQLESKFEACNRLGTVYALGRLSAEAGDWQVAVVQVGGGNVHASLGAHQAISDFDPEVVLCVGVASGLKKVTLGDVVVATKVYCYESGKDGPEGFRTRTELGMGGYALIQRAISEAREDRWRARAPERPGSAAAQVFIGPIAAGEKVLSCAESELVGFLQAHYGDALAVEREGHGVMQAAHQHHVPAIVVRGIADLMNDEDSAEGRSRQETAARNASAFAFAILARMGHGASVDSPPRRSLRDEIEEFASISGGEVQLGLSADEAKYIVEFLASGRFANIDTSWLGKRRLRSDLMRTSPRRTVRLECFHISRTPVTNRLFSRFVEETNYQTLWEREKREQTWRTLGGDSAPDHPVRGIAWADAEAFCDWIGGRLPTSDEYERVVRGSEGRLFPWGNEWKPGCCNDLFWVGDKTTSSVKCFEKEGQSCDGVFDLCGNVFEWVAPTPVERPSRNDLGMLAGGSYKKVAVLRGNAVARLLASKLTTADDVGFRYVRKSK